MPCIVSVTASGSTHCCGRRVTRLAARLPSPTTATLTSSFATIAFAPGQYRSSLPPCPRSFPSPTRRPPLSPLHGPPLYCLNALQTRPRRFADTSKPALETETTAFQGLANVAEDADHFTPFRPQLSRNARKALRRSRPTDVLASIHGLAKDLYWAHLSGSSASSHAAHQPPSQHPHSQGLAATHPALQLSEPVSLYSVLARYLKHRTSFAPAKSGFQFTAPELHMLRSRGYSPESVEQWAACLVEPQCNVAARIFEQQFEAPPLFLLLLFLRRKHIRVHALGIIMRHLDRLTQAGTLQWSQVKIIAVRLLRHAREMWPESMPWITSFLTTQSSRLLDNTNRSNLLSTRMFSDMTHFYNYFLVLICLPTSVRPLVCATYQEKAQFQLLKYMANTSPPIVVSRPGFRAVARNQLAHAKTGPERDWAELKGASWPPWKENRTAMDEDKGYKFGASRASKLLHRMYEAGYTHRTFEDMVQIYAGWDTDHSPTIQTRTSLPRFSSQFNNDRHIRPLLWAGRIRTTRTQREAWACFLSQELSGEAAHSEIYLAMFEKLHYPAVQRTPNIVHSSDPDRASEEDCAHLLPGDMKEVLPDPSSSLHHVYLSEPVPRPSELLERMRNTHIKPSRRLLAFLLETYPDFQTCLDLLHMNRDDFNGGIGRILYGIHDENDASIHSINGHLFKAIIRFLCRFGRFDQPPPRNLNALDPKEHAQQIQTNRNYLVAYAHGLLIRYRPKHRVAWTTFINKLLYQKSLPQSVQVERYRLICDLLDHMEQADLDVDDDIFSSACVATTYAAQSVGHDTITVQDERLLFSTGSSRLRALFNNLVGANADVHSRPEQLASSVILPHVPGPAELHAYVRALGILGDFEGLYSFTTWLTKHRSEVNVRAQAQRGGMDVLFRTLVALRLATSGGGLSMGTKHSTNAPEDIALLIRKQIESIEEWGGWPTEDHVKMYVGKQFKAPTLSAGGR